MDVPQFIAGRFRIEEEIGRGGMGTVYRAIHLGLERPVAVKIIKPEFAADRDVADRFLREARTMAKLRHPHAAMIFDAGNLPDGRHFIVMEFVEGATLSESLAHEGRFSAERAVSIAVQICDVLAEAHQLGIIHRDLKPSNIMLNERGVCVLDFGVAKVLVTSTELTATHATTGSGQIVGTPRYMSPEQCLGQRVGARSDLYSLGVVLYEMLAGRPPFIDPLPSAVLVKQATAPPPPLPQMRPDIPRQLAIAVHSLLAKRPEDRPRTAAGARATLEKSLRRPERPVPEVDPLSSTIAVLAKRSSMAFRLAAPLATVVFLGALLFVWGNKGETATRHLQESSTAAAELEPISAHLSTRLARVDKSAGVSAAADRGRAREALSDALESPTAVLDRARRIAAAGSRGSIRDLQVLETASGLAVAAIQYEPNGAARFFVMAKRGGAFRVLVRGPLDTRNFNDAAWTAETIDADGDNYDEILFTGVEAGGRTSSYRYVLYVPKNRQSYVLEFESKRHGGKLLKVAWSKTVLSANGSAYGKVLRERANRTIAAMRRR
jgi:serine/threonine protein kinase